MASPAEMYSAPATPFVAAFVGTVNRPRGCVAATLPSEGVRALSLAEPLPAVSEEPAPAGP